LRGHKMAIPMADVFRAYLFPAPKPKFPVKKPYLIEHIIREERRRMDTEMEKLIRELEKGVS
jgi:hypothetical protein